MIHRLAAKNTAIVKPAGDDNGVSQHVTHVTATFEICVYFALKQIKKDNFQACLETRIMSEKLLSDRKEEVFQRQAPLYSLAHQLT